MSANRRIAVPFAAVLAVLVWLLVTLGLLTMWNGG